MSHLGVELDFDTALLLVKDEQFLASMAALQFLRLVFVVFLVESGH